MFTHPARGTVAARRRRVTRVSDQCRKKSHILHVLAGATVFALALTTGNARASSPTTFATYGDGNFGSPAGGNDANAAGGTATAAYPLVLPRARGSVQPLLSMRYAHTGGLGELGVGWSLSLPSIERRGLADGPPLMDSTDVYELAGSRLVLLCTSTSAQSCVTGNGTTLKTPAWVPNGWAVWRPAVDSAYVHVYSNSTTTATTWRVQARNGDIMEFGTPLFAPTASPNDSEGGFDAILNNSPTPQIYRWKLVRQADVYTGANPTNLILYQWRHTVSRDVSILTDVFYTPPASGVLTDSSAYAHHIRLNYLPGIDRTTLHVVPPIWLRPTEYVVHTIDVASKGLSSAREQVRRYYLDYVTMLNRPYLQNVRMEGHCSVTETPQPDGRWTTAMLPAGANCPAFGRGTAFTYTPEAVFDGNGAFLTPTVFSSVDLMQVDSTGNPVPAPAPAFCPYFGAAADINRDGVVDFVCSPPNSGWTPRAYINSGSATGTASFLATPLDHYVVDGLFSDQNGVTVFGDWGDRWSAGLLFRSYSTSSVAPGYVEIQPWGGSFQTAVLHTITAPSLPPPHVYGDLDNDGTQDVIYLDGTAAPPALTVAKASRRSISTAAEGGGIVNPFNTAISTNLQLRTTTYAPRYAQLADMDGDGILDYVTTKDPTSGLGDFVYIPGHGDGTFGCAPAAQSTSPPGAARCIQATGSPGYNASSPSSSAYEVRLVGSFKQSDGSFATGPLPQPAPQDSHLMPLNSFHDVTGDGKAELVRVLKSSDGISVEIYINVDGVELRRIVDPLPEADFQLYVSGTNNAGTNLLFGDVDGNGVDDVIICGDSTCVFKSYQGSATLRHPGLLSQIVDGSGATTTFEYYENLAALERLQTQTAAIYNPWPEEGVWRRHAPAATAVVSKVTTLSNTPAPYNRAVVKEFNYRDPVYDHWRKRLKGFARTRVTENNLAVDTTYLFEGCLREDAAAQNAGCANPELDSAESYYGVPWVISRLDASSGVHHSTIVNSYTVQPNSDQGVGSKYVSFAYVSRTDTYLYDTAAFVPSPSSVTYYSPTQQALTVTVQADAIHLRRDQTFDAHCNIQSTLDYGKVYNDGTTQERVIRTTFGSTEYSSADSQLGTNYRISSTSTAYDAGGIMPMVNGIDGPTRAAQYGYDPFGRLTAIVRTESGALPLQRFHEAGRPIAPEPAGTPNGSGLYVTYTYDNFGNIITRRGPNGECQTTDFSTDFKDQPVAEHVWLGASCAAPELRTTFGYDRGLNVLLQTSGPNGVSRSIEYDAFGRVLRTHGPDANGNSQLESTVQYSDPDSPTHWSMVTRNAIDPLNQSVAWSFVDNFGDPVVTFSQADTAAGDGADWIAHPEPVKSDNGQPGTWYRPWFFSGDPASYVIGPPAGEAAFSAGYDFMRRRTRLTRASDGQTTEIRAYHALSADRWDAENLQSDSSHFGMYSTTEGDGHGRSKRSIKRTEGGILITEVQHLATGEPNAVQQSDDTGHAYYRRWLRYDSIGRIVENAEPNTAVNWGLDPASATSMTAWRYVYDYSGRVVGTRDARGCGKNITYDLAGRVLTEDYSPCLVSQPSYTAPNAAGDGTEVFNRYDSPEIGQTTDYGGNAAFLTGKLVATSDRGAHTRFAYDGRGRHTAIARQIVKPGTPSGTLASRYTNHWFRSATTFDDVDRVAQTNPGADVPELMGSSDGSVHYHYTRRGVVGSVDGSYGTLVENQTFDADGLPSSQTFGDATHATAHYVYDDRRRLQEYHLVQNVPIYDTLLDLAWQTYGYDEVGNILSITDQRDPARWPAGAQPVSRTMTYDSMYRVLGVSYAHGGDPQTSPFEAEEAAADVRPIPRYLAQTRVTTQSFGYDPIGNLTSAVDDAFTTFDRGLGTVTVGTLSAADQTIRKPHQLLSVDGQTSNGAAEAHYDSAGNLVDLAVERDGPCSGPLQKCAQRYTYTWDEVGQLATASRWDYSTLTGQALYPSPPSGLATTALAYVYSGGDRVLRKSSDPTGAPVYAVTPLSSLRLNHSTYSAGSNDYERDSSTETVYLGGLGRVLYSATMPNAGTSNTHVFLNFGDHIGSSSLIVDKDTGEVVEAISYQPYGATESDYRPSRWESFREDLRFTGKEEDIEVGLTYFGARYYSPYLARFISADPLAVHGMGGDINPYAYVSGRVFNETDALGLCSKEGCTDPPQPEQPPQQGPGKDKTQPAPAGGGGGGLYKVGAPGPYVAPPPPPPAGPAYGAGVLGLAAAPQRLIAALSLNPATPIWVQPPSVASVPTDYVDQPTPVGSADQFAIGFARSAVQLLQGDTNIAPLVNKYIIPDDDGPSWYLAAGHGAAHLAAIVLGGEANEVNEVVNEARVLAAEGAAGGGGGRLALGVSEHLDTFAARQGASTWKSFPDPMSWKTTMLEKLADPNTKILFNLEGPVEVWPGVSRAARGAGGATDWELLQIQQNPQWWNTIEWWQGGKQVPNPFQ